MYYMAGTTQNCAINKICFFPFFSLPFDPNTNGTKTVCLENKKEAAVCMVSIGFFWPTQNRQNLFLDKCVRVKRFFFLPRPFLVDWPIQRVQRPIEILLPRKRNMRWWVEFYDCFTWQKSDFFLSFYYCTGHCVISFVSFLKKSGVKSCL